MASRFTNLKPPTFLNLKNKLTVGVSIHQKLNEEDTVDDFTAVTTAKESGSARESLHDPSLPGCKPNQSSKSVNKDIQHAGVKIYPSDSVYYFHLGLAAGGLFCGVFHIVYCCHFYSSGVGIWNGILVGSMALRGLFYPRPLGPKLAMYGHLIILLSGIVVASLSAIGIHCTTRSCDPYMKGVRMREECAARFIAVTHYSRESLAKINKAILSMMFLMALTQCFVAIHVGHQKIFKFIYVMKDALNIYYGLSLLGLVCLIFGTAHTMLCSHLFYIGGGVWLSFLVMVSGAYGNSRKFRNIRTLKFAICVCVWCCSVLVAIGSFGIYCWRPVGAGSLNETRPVCQAPPEWPNVYRNCYTRLELLGYWDSKMDVKMNELKEQQVTFSFLLILSGGAAGLCSSWILHRLLQHPDVNDVEAVV